MVSRALYITFYILYLISLGISLWYLILYSNTPAWVWSLFAVAILIAIIGVLLKEFLLKRTVTCSGKDVTPGYYTFWSTLYIIFHIIAFILIGIGLFFVIKYSSIPWYVWVILLIALILSIIANMITGLSGGSQVGNIFSIIFAVSAFILFIVGIIFVIIYSNSPWWVWLLIALTILLAILAGMFDVMSDKNETIVNDCTVDCVPKTCGTPIIQLQPIVPSIYVQPVQQGQPLQVQPVQQGQPLQVQPVQQ